MDAISEDQLRGLSSFQGIDQRLAAIAAEVLAGKHYECPWELFRLQHFPDWSEKLAFPATN